MTARPDWESIADSVEGVFPLAGKVPAVRRGQSWQTPPPEGWDWDDPRITGWGWAIPPGTLVVDIDVDPAWQIAESLGLTGLQSLVVETAKGLHIYLEGDAAVIGGLPGRLMVAGRHCGELKKFGGYVVGAGSLHPTGKRYRVAGNRGAREEEIARLMVEGVAAMPAGLAETLGRRPPDRRRAESAGGMAPGAGWDTQVYESALHAMPTPADRDSWLRLSMAAHAAGVGYAAWDAWCRRGGGYDERKNRRTWESLDGGAITAGTLIHAAREAGWEPPPQTPRQARSNGAGGGAQAGRRGQGQRKELAPWQKRLLARMDAAEARRNPESATPHPAAAVSAGPPTPRPAESDAESAGPPSPPTSGSADQEGGEFAVGGTANRKPDPAVGDTATAEWMAGAIDWLIDAAAAEAEAARRIAAGMPVADPGDEF